jgi:tetratricopeptide (TPR) repeat protein
MPSSITLSISGPAENQYLVSRNDEPSHHVPAETVVAIIDRSITASWKTSPREGAELGAKIFDLLDGSGGMLREKISASRAEGTQLAINLFMPPSLDIVPFELLFDLKTTTFILPSGDVHLVRRVNDRNKKASPSIDKRPLQALFMACSPSGTADAVLSFEKEESSILNATHSYPLDMEVEDTGSLEGLRQALYLGASYRDSSGIAAGSDIVHLTGHAGIDADGPIFRMEDELGGPRDVTPQTLWEEALHEFKPRMLFLSGCSTGKGDKVNDKPSFAWSMVEAGIPFVLGWALPVADAHATALAAVLYEHLAAGKRLDESIAETRRKTAERYGSWPLLRLFADGSDCGAFIAPGQRVKPGGLRKVRHKSLVESQVRVLEEGFVGRRRQLQEGLRVLRGQSDRFGLLITGTAGVGKSCLAGRLIERLQHHRLLVVHGLLTPAAIVPQLRASLEKEGDAEGLKALEANADLPEKMEELFRTTFKNKEYLLLFDDFEQNLEPFESGYRVASDYLPFVKACVTALPWAEGTSAMIITSRYPFALEADGRDIVAANLRNIPLAAMRDADLDKKVSSLTSVSSSKHACMYVDAGKGNLRLLDWLELIAADEKRYDLPSLRKAVEGKNEEFVAKYLAEIMVRAHGDKFNRFMRSASIFRRPVPRAAFETLGDATQLEIGVGLTLLEKEDEPGRGAAYWVTPVIREKYLGELAEEEKKELHAKAFEWYDKKIRAEEEEKRDPKEQEEAVFHALESGRVIEACWHAVDVGAYYERIVLYYAQRAALQRVADRFTPEVVLQAIERKEENVAMLLNNLGEILRGLGEPNKAIECYKRSLAINLAVFGEKHQYIAINYNNLGLAWNALGEPRKAIDHFERALAIDLAVFGDKHPNVAIRYNNIGLAWKALGEPRKAIEYYERALAIDLVVFGDKHPYTAIDYNNLGEAWRVLGEPRRAIEFNERALAIDLVVFGDKHPDTAINYNNLGLAWDDLGEPRKAIEYCEKALEIDLAVFGDKHPKVAIRYNNLGMAWNALGNKRKALDYYHHALDIFTAFYGPDHPNTKIVRKNMDAVSGNS